MVRFALLSGAASLLLVSCADQDALSGLEAELAEARAALDEAQEALVEAEAGVEQLQAFRELDSTLGTAVERADAVATIVDKSGEEVGEAALINGDNGMIIRLYAEGVPRGFHGVHLHQVGDCSDNAAGFKASGSHINVSGAEHGLLNPAGFHTGADFPNLWAGEPGLVGELFAGGLTLSQALDEDGFALIIHENEDDHVTQPIGGAGGRIACAAFN